LGWKIARSVVKGAAEKPISVRARLYGLHKSSVEQKKMSFRACVRTRSPRFWALSHQQSPGAPHLARFSRDVGYRRSPPQACRGLQEIDSGAKSAHV